MFSGMKTIVFWVFIAICLMMLWAIVQRSANMGKEAEYSYSDLYDKVQSGQLLDAVIQGNELRGHLKVSPKDEFRTTLPPNYDDLLQAMLAAKVNVAIRAPRSHFPAHLLVNVGPIALMVLASHSGRAPVLGHLQKGGLPANSLCPDAGSPGEPGLALFRSFL